MDNFRPPADHVADFRKRLRLLVLIKKTVHLINESQAKFVSRDSYYYGEKNRIMNDIN